MRTINEHLQNIYGEGEVDPGATIRKFRIVRREGSREVEREVEHYSLDAILAVGYRVPSGISAHFPSAVEDGVVDRNLATSLVTPSNAKRNAKRVV